MVDTLDSALALAHMESHLLSRPELEQLDDLEQKIQTGLDTFFEVGQALAEIREGRLYRQTHENFEAYCNDRWGFSKRRANQLIAASGIVDGLGTIVPALPLPTNESQARPLAQLAEERRAEAWTRAVTAAGGTPTQDQVRQVVDEMLGKAGRFDNKKVYPVYRAGKLVYNEPLDRAYSDPRFKGADFILGADLNKGKEYDAYALVEVLVFTPPPFEAVFGPKPETYYRLYYPVKVDAKVIYNAPYTNVRPNELYADCKWVGWYELESTWASVVIRYGEYQVQPARAIPEPTAPLKFQPGQVAICEECAKSTWLDPNIPYDQWRRFEADVWTCPKGHRKADVLLLIYSPELAAQIERQNQEKEAARQAEELVRQQGWEIKSVIQKIAGFIDVKKLAPVNPALLHAVVDKIDKAAQDGDFDWDEASREVLEIVREWLPDNVSDDPDRDVI